VFAAKVLEEGVKAACFRSGFLRARWYEHALKEEQNAKDEAEPRRSEGERDARKFCGLGGGKLWNFELFAGSDTASMLMKEGTLMNEGPKPEKEKKSPTKSSDDSAAEKAQVDSEAKAEELRTALQGKGEQGKSSLGSLPVDED